MKKKAEETLSEEETRIEKENNKANSSTTVSSLSESETGHSTQQLRKRDKLKTKKPHKGRISASASATSVALVSKLKLSTSLSFKTSVSKYKSKRSATAYTKTTEIKGEQSVVISDEEQEASRVKPEEPADDIPEKIALPERKRDKRPGP